MEKKLILSLLTIALITVGCKKENSSTPPTPTPTPLTTEGLPVVFHVLYEDPSNITQNPSANLIHTRIEQINKYYAGTLYPTAGSTPINVKFGAALYDPAGNALKEPGIHRVKYTGATNLGPEAFLKAKHPAGSPNFDIFWDPHKYINIWILGFNEKNTTGISFLGFTTSLHPLVGLAHGDTYVFNLPDFMYGIALNNAFFHTDETGPYTLAHEMGHYLGLYHAFDDKSSCDQANDASDDYCIDTPKYDRAAYEKSLDEILKIPAAAHSLPTLETSALAANIAQPQWFGTKVAIPEEAYYRTSCSGLRFKSTNVMDYYVTTQQVFTPNQRHRVEHTLKYGPLVPREDNTKAYAGFESMEITDEQPTPIIMRCSVGSLCTESH